MTECRELVTARENIEPNNSSVVSTVADMSATIDLRGSTPWTRGPRRGTVLPPKRRTGKHVGPGSDARYLRRWDRRLAANCVRERMETIGSTRRNVRRTAWDARRVLCRRRAGFRAGRPTAAETAKTSRARPNRKGEKNHERARRARTVGRLLRGDRPRADGTDSAADAGEKSEWKEFGYLLSSHLFAAAAAAVRDRVDRAGCGGRGRPPVFRVGVS